jgi:hypothetical protein
VYSIYRMARRSVLDRRMLSQYRIQTLPLHAVLKLEVRRILGVQALSEEDVADRPADVSVDGPGRRVALLDRGRVLGEPLLHRLERVLDVREVDAPRVGGQLLLLLDEGLELFDVRGVGRRVDHALESDVLGGYV